MAFFENLFNKGKTVLKGKSPEEIRTEVKRNLDKSADLNKGVIDKEMRRIRANSTQDLSDPSNARSVEMIKKALFSLKLNDEAYRRLSELRSEEQLYEAMNALTKALKGTIKADRKSEKPHNRAFARAAKWFSGSGERSANRLEGLYGISEEALGDIVPTAAVTGLMNGEYLEDLCSATNLSMDREEFRYDAEVFLYENGFNGDANVDPSAMRFE